MALVTRRLTDTSRVSASLVKRSCMPFCSGIGHVRYRPGISLLGEILCLRSRRRVVRGGRVVPLFGMSVEESR